MTFLITQHHVRSKYRHLPCPCTRRHHLRYSAYKRVVAYQGNDLVRANLVQCTPGGVVLQEGSTHNFWPLCPVRSGPFLKIMTDWAEIRIAAMAPTVRESATAYAETREYA